MTSIGVVGATGQVGAVMRQLLEERDFPADEVRFFASARSAGKTLPWKGGEIVIEDAATADPSGLDIALFSAGATMSRVQVPAVRRGRRHGHRQLVGVPQGPRRSRWSSARSTPATSRRRQAGGRGIIANPNCTTMAAMPVLKPLHDEAGLVRLVVATYQAVSGSGVAGVRGAALAGPRRGREGRRADPRRVRRSTSRRRSSYVAPDRVQRPAAGRHRSSTTAGTRPTRSRSSATRAARSSASPTCGSRAPACGSRCSPGHSLSIHAEFARPITLERATEILRPPPASSSSTCPTPLQAAGTDPSLVGRIRQDQALDGGTGLVLFVSGDNLRKGAALNTIQIAELLV